MSAKKNTAQQKTRTRNVRVVPQDERAGYLANNITWRGRKFTSQWTEVSAPIAAQLKTLDQPGNPGVRLFDVMTDSQIMRMEAATHDAELRTLVSKNRLRENELRVAKERRDPRTDFDDPIEDDEDDGEDDAEDEFTPDPDPDGAKIDAEIQAEEKGGKDWSSWENDLNSTDDAPVPGPPTPAKRQGMANKAKKKASKAKKKASKSRGGRAAKKT